MLGIPAEAYAAAPLEAAECHWPLLLRAACGREAPTLHKGGLIKAIPKPNKPPSDLTGWRNVLLQEPAAKAIGRSFRSRIVGAFQHHSLPVQCGSQRRVPLELPMLHVRAHMERLAKRRQSGGMLFVDARDAYYSVIKHFLFTDGVLDTPQQLEMAICRVHPDEAARAQLAAALVGPGLLEVADPPVRNYVRSVLCGAWTTTHDDASFLYEAFTGTTPGAPLADVLFQLVFSLALKSLQARLEAHDLLVDWEPPGRAQLATWADDLSIPLVATTAVALAPAAAAAARHVHASLATVGLQVNFAPGKTEAMLTWRGAGSRAIRQQLLCEARPALPLVLDNGDKASLSLTRSYVHLGGLVRDDQTQLEDLERRRHLAMAVFVKLRKHLLFNPQLQPVEKLSLLFALVHRRFLHGAGFWALASHRERHLFRTAIFQWYRSSFRPITGLSVRGLTDDEVLAVLGVLGPDEILHIERFRLVMTVAHLGDAALWSTLTANAGWAQVAVNAAACVSPGCPSTFELLLPWVKERPRQCRLAIRAFRRSRLARRAECRQSALAHARWLHSLHKEGGTSFQLRLGHEQKRFTCALCGAGCGSRAALAAHCSKAHGLRAEATQVNGTACMCCATEFWTTPRLRLHLRRQEPCLLAHLGSDIAYSTEEYVDDSACRRRPAVHIPIATPFWATLRPQRLAIPEPPSGPAVPMLLRCLRASAPAIIFRDLVLMGIQQELAHTAYVQLASDVRLRLVSGSPGLETGSLCTIIALAGQAVRAALSDVNCACEAYRFAAIVVGDRCTFICT